MFKTGCDPERLRDVLWNLSKLSPPDSGSEQEEDHVQEQTEPDYFAQRYTRGQSLPAPNSPTTGMHLRELRVRSKNGDDIKSCVISQAAKCFALRRQAA